ncbi:MAG TPA: hypothetical protein VJ964_14490 [Balneolaceae bacterium]|nr:hypothetical protein [Balneolaceae bacterium]
MFDKSLFISAVLFFVCGWTGYAQQINFSQYHSYNLSVGELNSNNLDFGQVVSGSGQYSLDINSGKVISITGVQYLDVIVEVTFNDLYLNGNPANAGNSQKSIPFNLKAAYANNKGTPNIGQAKFINNISGNSFTVRFPILERQGRPPGPPPAPPTNAFDQSKVEETAYLYLFGSINVGNVDAGPYSSDITVTINYD